MKANKRILDEYVENQKLRTRKHELKDLHIYNYTKHTEYNRLWDDITKVCRGLVIDSNGNVIAYPYEKFFNMGQLDPALIKKIKEEGVPYEVFEKMDGFLGIGFMYEGEFITASRGSFESEPSMFFNKVWNEKYAPYLEPKEGLTYIFEIINQEQKIQVEYDFSDIVLLGVRITESGEDIPYENLKYVFTGDNRKYPPIVKRYENITDFTTVRELFSDRNDGQSEGFIVRFGGDYNGFRIKLKYDEYMRIAQVLSGVSTKSIWRTIRDHKDINDILEAVPDEFYTWVEETYGGLMKEYFDIADDAIAEYKKVHDETLSDKEMYFKIHALDIPRWKKSLLQLQYSMKFEKFDEVICRKIEPNFESPRTGVY